mmetsp:Transcript_14308/g.28854  ORF Transcript_14308/g.28854 Transcript_14308/m.28854 type:complete len:204 (-) Transcript_14308:337-948(-)
MLSSSSSSSTTTPTSTPTTTLWGETVGAAAGSRGGFGYKDYADMVNDKKPVFRASSSGQTSPGLHTAHAGGLFEVEQPATEGDLFSGWDAKASGSSPASPDTSSATFSMDDPSLFASSLGVDDDDDDHVPFDEEDPADGGDFAELTTSEEEKKLLSAFAELGSVDIWSGDLRLTTSSRQQQSFTAKQQSVGSSSNGGGFWGLF